MHKLSGARYGLLFFSKPIDMENIDERLSTLSAKRQKQFQRILEKELGTDFPEAGRVAQRIKEKTRAKILRYLGNEHQEKIE